MEGVISYEKIVLADNINRKKLIDLIASLDKKDISNKSAKANVFVDQRDGQSYKTVNLAGNTWFAEDLRFDVGKGSFYPNDTKRHMSSYGRLYTWWAANDACPPGWRLPSSEEWKELILFYGGYMEEVKFFPERRGADLKGAYKTLTRGGKAGFYASKAGACYNGKRFEGFRSWGSYWSSSVPLVAYEAIYFHFSGYDEEIFRRSINKYWGYSCRCIKEK